jgi:hypothetical protein
MKVFKTPAEARVARFAPQLAHVRVRAGVWTCGSLPPEAEKPATAVPGGG